LKIKSHQRISPYLSECCLRASANVSYENADQDIARYTGISISAKTQQPGETREILDWFHLVENLSKVGGSNRRIYQAKKLLS
jgi:hypothetical protein